MGWLTAQFDSTLLLHHTPTVRGIDLTNCYKYHRHIQHADPDDGAEDISETLLLSSTLARLVARDILTRIVLLSDLTLNIRTCALYLIHNRALQYAIFSVDEAGSS
jgi:hypothetical protein